MKNPKIAPKLLRAACAATLLSAIAAQAAPSVAPTPFIPTYGQEVSLQLKDAAWPTWIPATRYARNGNHFTIDYEFRSSALGCNGIHASRSRSGNWNDGGSTPTIV